MSTAPADTRYDQAAIEADDTVPMIHIWRDFAGTPEQLFRAHTDPELFARWVGPAGMGADILEWDATDNGKWRYSAGEGEHAQHFRGSFHTVREDRIVQTFTWEGMPDGVALETLTFEDLGDGRTKVTFRETYHVFNPILRLLLERSWMSCFARSNAQLDFYTQSRDSI
jgi:uncharacterized protein YndB with AHSA1/START domain